MKNFNDSNNFFSYSEAARRIAASGKPIIPSPRSAALISQTQNMAALRHKRQQYARLPPKISVNQLPRIQRRTDAPLRPHLKPINRISNNIPFLDNLLRSQEELYLLQNIQMQG